MTKPTKWHVRPTKTQVSLNIRSFCWFCHEVAHLHNFVHVFLFKYPKEWTGHSILINHIKSVSFYSFYIDRHVLVNNIQFLTSEELDMTDIHQRIRILTEAIAIFLGDARSSLMAQ